MKRTGDFLAVAALALLAPLAVAAQAPSTTVAKGETVTDNLVRFGSDVTVEGTVTGDVIVAAPTVAITGTVEGDVLGFASALTVSGTVKGNIRAAAQQITVSGTVGRNFTVVGSRVELTKDSNIGGTVAVAAEQADFVGRIGRSLVAHGMVVNLGGTVGTDARVLLSRSRGAALNLASDPALSVGGNLHYRARQTVDVPAGAVKGRVAFDRITGETFQTSLASAVAVGRVVRFAGVLLVGLLLMWLLPGLVPAIVEEMRSVTGRAVLTGALLFFLAPAALFLLLFTLVGIPLALVLLVLYLFAAATAKLFAGYWVGGMLAERFHWKLPRYAVLAVGFAVLELVLTALPSLKLGGLEFPLRVVTGIANLFVIVWVMGSLARRAWRRVRPVKPATTA